MKMLSRAVALVATSAALLSSTSMDSGSQLSRTVDLASVAPFVTTSAQSTLRYGEAETATLLPLVADTSAVNAELVGPPAVPGRTAATTSAAARVATAENDADADEDAESGATLPPAARAKMSGVVAALAMRGGDEPAPLIVRYAEHPELFEAGRVEALGGEVVRHYESLDMLAVRLPADALVDLALEDSVARLSLDDKVMTLGSERATANLPTAGSTNSYFLGGSVGVAVVDSGIAAHEDFEASVRQYSFLNGAVPVPDLVNNEQADGLDDKYGHGTHVAGILSGQGTSDADYIGVATSSTLLSLQALDHNGSGSTSDVIAAIDWLGTYGQQFNIRVVNLSLGQGVTESIDTDPLVAAVEALWDQGYVVVVAAGNYGNNGYGTVMSPANSRKVITVGSLTDSGTGNDDSDDYVSSFSSRGPTLGDMILKPDLLAPGNRIVAPIGKASKLKKDLDGRVINCKNSGCTEKYLELSGTSMAAPIVSAAVAMMLEKDPTLTPATIKARLMRSATKIDAPPIEAGAGVLNVDAALNETGVISGEALSPRMMLDDTTEGVFIEDTASLWGDDVWGSGYLWTNGFTWASGYMWTDGSSAQGYLWTDGGGTQANGYMWTDGVNANGYLWTDGSSAQGYMWTDEGRQSRTRSNSVMRTEGDTLVLVDDPNPQPID